MSVTKINRPALIKAAGTPVKTIEEFVGRISTGTENLSIARMISPAGWQEPGQTPDFTETTIVLKGLLRVTTRDEVLDISAGQAVTVDAGEWVRYSTPLPGGAEYVAVCLPAFAPEHVHRDL